MGRRYKKYLEIWTVEVYFVAQSHLSTLILKLLFLYEKHPVITILASSHRALKILSKGLRIKKSCLPGDNRLATGF